MYKETRHRSARCMYRRKKTDPVTAGFFQNLGEPEVVPEVRIGPFLFTAGESNAVKV